MVIIISKRFTNPENIKTVNPLLLNPGEVFIDITTNIVPFVYDYYQISNFGRVYHKYLNIFLKPGINGSGYYFVMLSTENGPKPIQIHRLVMIAFDPVEGYESLEVNHNDGNKLNPKLSNLEWNTRKENIQHSYDTGLHGKNENSPKTNLTNNIVISICKLLEENKYTNKEIANMVGNGVTVNIVSSIKQRESWVDISSKYSFYQRPGHLFDENDINMICRYFEDFPINDLTVNQHCRNALQYIGLDCFDDKLVDSARKIYNRKYYTKISCNYNF